MNLSLLAHGEATPGPTFPIGPWELHPATTHFPLGLLFSGVLLDLYAWARGRPELGRAVAGLFVAGVAFGVVTALAGLLAFFTVPAHTAEAHDLMYWHLGVTLAALGVFAWPASVRWRTRPVPPTTAVRLAGLAGAALLAVGGALGGYLVYHGGAGVDPQLLAPEVRGSHSHADGPPPPPGQGPKEPAGEHHH